MTQPRESASYCNLLDLATARTALLEARALRNQLIRQLVAQGEERHAIAVAAGLHKSRIDQIVRWGRMTDPGESDSMEVQNARHQMRTDSDAMSASIVRRLGQIQRQLDGLRVDSRHMVPRPDHEVIVPGRGRAHRRSEDGQPAPDRVLHTGARMTDLETTVCPTPQKRRWSSAAAAKRASKAGPKKKAFAMYSCVCGGWHLTNRNKNKAWRAGARKRRNQGNPNTEET